MNVSICLATYNGEKFIFAQLYSIICQLSEYDEIIVVDDCSTDNTLSILESFNDKRIKLYRNQFNKGVVFSFERSISLASNDVIFMSDQDDIWIEGRIDLLRSELVNSDALLISSNLKVIDSYGNFINFDFGKLSASFSNFYFLNIFNIFLGKGYYYGCAMAFKKELKEVVLPIPKYVESHDLWIALAANILKSNLHINSSTIYRRVHGNNASIIERRLFQKIISRLIHLISIFSILFRKISLNFKL